MRREEADGIAAKEAYEKVKAFMMKLAEELSPKSRLILAMKLHQHGSSFIDMELNEDARNEEVEIEVVANGEERMVGVE